MRDAGDERDCIMNCGSWYDRSGLERVASELTKMSLSSNLNAPEPGLSLPGPRARDTQRTAFRSISYSSNLTPASAREVCVLLMKMPLTLIP